MTGKYIIIIGLILIIAGIVFTMQSKSIVGPSSSFMYQNPEWTVNGYVIIALGTIMSVFGLVVWQIGTKKTSIVD
jgi:F0F1-type ATP synthase membrane subunit c/vacuolar-type H+-ATPase subunit K